MPFIMVTTHALWGGITWATLEDHIKPSTWGFHHALAEISCIHIFGVYHITPRPCLGSRRLHYHLGWPARHHLKNDIITHPPCRWEFMWSWCISGVSKDFISKRSSTRHHHSSTIWRRGSGIFGGFLKDSRSQIKGGFPWAAREGHRLHL